MNYAARISACMLLTALCNITVHSETRQPVKVGVALPLTGEVAMWGIRTQRGFQLALQDTHHPISIEYQDEGSCEAKRSVTAVTKFLNLDSIKLLFLGCLSGTKAVGALLQREGALAFSTGLLDEEVYQLHYPVINLATQLATESRYIAAHLQSRGYSRIALLRWPDAFGEEFSRSLRAELKLRTIEVVFDDSAGTMDANFRSFMPRFKQLKVDAIATSLGDAQISTLAKQLRENGLSIPIVSNYVVETTSAPSELLEGTEYTYPVNSAESSPQKAAFDNRYQLKFSGDLPSINSYFAYDGIMALDRALDACAASDIPCLRSHILSDRAVGLSGDVSYKPDGSNHRPYGIKRIQKGKFVWINRDVKL